MFDFSFSELIVLGIVGLLVLGPERLPVAARNVGVWVSRFKTYMFNVQRDIKRSVAEKNYVVKKLHSDVVSVSTEIQKTFNTELISLNAVSEVSHSSPVSSLYAREYAYYENRNRLRSRRLSRAIPGRTKKYGTRFGKVG